MQKLELRAHLIELRNRFMIVALFVVIGCVLAIIFQTEVIAALLKPMAGESLIYTSPYGGFEFIFKVILSMGLIFAIPVCLLQIFKFIAPALPEKIDGLGTKIIIISSLLAISGVSFAYFVAIPASLQFLSTIGGDFLDSFISTNEYLSFFMVYLLGFAVIFQLPLIMSIIDKNHPLKPKVLIRKQKYIIAGSYLVAALLTPTPDAMNQTIMALPIVVLYQVGIGVIWTQRKGAGTKDALTESETNWHAAPANQTVTTGDSVFDLEEEKNRFNEPRKRRRAKPRMVTDMISVPTAHKQSPVATKRPVSVSVVEASQQSKAVHRPETNRMSSKTKLPLSYNQHAVQKSKSAAPRRAPPVRPALTSAQIVPQQYNNVDIAPTTKPTSRATVHAKRSIALQGTAVKDQTVPPVHQTNVETPVPVQDRRQSYMNIMIKNRAQPLLQG